MCVWSVCSSLFTLAGALSSHAIELWRAIICFSMFLYITDVEGSDGVSESLSSHCECVDKGG